MMLLREDKRTTQDGKINPWGNSTRRTTIYYLRLHNMNVYIADIP